MSKDQSAFESRATNNERRNSATIVIPKSQIGNLLRRFMVQESFQLPRPHRVLQFADCFCLELSALCRISGAGPCWPSSAGSSSLSYAQVCESFVHGRLSPG